MISEFQYKGFLPDDHTVAEAEGILDRIQDLAPAGSTILSLLTYDQGNYSCSIDIFFKRGSVCASSSDSDVFKSLHRVETTIIDKLSKYKETRFYNRKADVLTNKSVNPFESIEQN